MKTKSIKQTVVLNATPAEVYDALLDSKKHAKFTGSPAKISNKVGGKHEAYGDYISGVNLVLIPGKKIVQTWHASDWPKGCSSKVTFTFAKSGKGTKLSFTHSGIPAEFVEEIAQGWTDYYWNPLRAFFGKKR